jgi:hypothetical protein
MNQGDSGKVRKETFSPWFIYSTMALNTDTFCTGTIAGGTWGGGNSVSILYFEKHALASTVKTVDDTTSCTAPALDCFIFASTLMVHRCYSRHFCKQKGQAVLNSLTHCTNRFCRKAL